MTKSTKQKKITRLRINAASRGILLTLLFSISISVCVEADEIADILEDRNSENSICVKTEAVSARLLVHCLSKA